MDDVVIRVAFCKYLVDQGPEIVSSTWWWCANSSALAPLELAARGRRFPRPEGRNEPIDR